MLKKVKNININKYLITTYVFLLIIFIIFIGMIVNSKSIGFSMLKGYKEYLPKSYKTFDIIKASIKSTESGINNNVVIKNLFIEINGFIQMLFNKKIIEDIDENSRIYKMKNGKLTFNYPEYNVSNSINSISQLYYYVSSLNMRMLYVQAPFKNNKYDNQLPKGVIDTTNSNADNFLEGIKRNNVPYIDLRKVINEQEINYNDLFYNTDHHWKTQTAFWAYSYLMDYLSKDLLINFDKFYTDKNNFTYIELKKSFLGAQGRRVGKYYGGVDDYVLMLPNFETNYNLKVINNDGTIKNDITGDFKSTIIKDDTIKYNTPINTNRYAAYFGGDFPLIKIFNTKSKTGSLLIIQDSFGLPFSAFMSLNFKQTDILDLRHFKNQTLYNYLKEHHYDIVLFLYNPSVYLNTQDDLQFTFK